ncbi:PepSY-associated TM helix domain-containing protein [Thermus thermophilus]|uniref:PepSY-associated TM helix domain-containing protein n=1 Tax=Thermus thermophilus TaxID=274 RepID=UPI0033901914
MLLYRVLGLLDPPPQLVQGQVVGHGHGRRIQQERVLHKGRDAPGGWKLCLDLSALFLALVSLTGLLLGVLLPKSRRAALFVLGLGGLLFCALSVYAVR